MNFIIFSPEASNMFCCFSICNFSQLSLWENAFLPSIHPFNSSMLCYTAIQPANYSLLWQLTLERTQHNRGMPSFFLDKRCSTYLFTSLFGTCHESWSSKSFAQVFKFAGLPEHSYTRNLVLVPHQHIRHTSFFVWSCSKEYVLCYKFFSIHWFQAVSRKICLRIFQSLAQAYMNQTVVLNHIFLHSMNVPTRIQIVFLQFLVWYNHRHLHLI